MKKFEDNLVGTHIAVACERLALAAPAWMEFNGVRVEAQLGDTAGDLRARWQAGMDRACEESDAKRKAFEQTDAGRAQLAAAAQRRTEEARARDEGLRRIEVSKVRLKFPWGPAMGEISGFGGDYEQACRQMLYAGLAWLESHPGEVGGTDSERGKLLEREIVTVCPDCSGAMFGATFSAVRFIASNGWEEYARRMTRNESKSEEA